MAGRAISVTLRVVVILARAEAGELAANARFGSNSARPNLNTKILTSASAKNLRKALTAWQLVEGQDILLAVLYRAGFLVRDEGGYWRPSPSAYTLLQLPSALSQRLLFESSGLSLPLSGDLVQRLTNNGWLPDEELASAVAILELFELVQFDGAGVYMARNYALKLLRALTKFDPTSTGTDTPDQLTLADEWEGCFPGRAAGRGWLRWEAEFWGYSFAIPQSGQPLSFDPWQLFRLLTLSDPTEAGKDQAEAAKFYFVKPVLTRIVAVARRGLSIKVLTSYLSDGLAQPLPPAARTEFNRWLRLANRYGARELVVVEASERAALKEFLADARLRSYVSEVISPRYIAIRKADLPRLQQLMARRQLFLQLDPGLEPLASHSQALTLTLGRPQLQEVVSALVFYRRQQVQLGYPALETDELLALLQNSLTLKEQAESQRRVDELGDGGDHYFQEQADNKLTDAQIGKLIEQLEETIVQEAEVLIQYTVPGRAAQKRWIEPLVIRNEGDYFYLDAYCQLRQDQRVFRLDRLRLLEVRQ